MWHIGQLLQNKAGQRVIYAGFDYEFQLEAGKAMTCFKLLDGQLVKERFALGEYKELPGEPVPIGLFAHMLNGGFFGEIDLEKLRKHALYKVALETLGGAL